MEVIARIARTEVPRDESAYGAVLDWAPDGGTVAVSTPHQVEMYASDGQRLFIHKRELTMSPWSKRSHVAWAPDGRHVAIFATLPNPHIDILDMAGNTVCTIGKRCRPVHDAAWAPDDTTIAVGYYTGIIRLHDGHTGQTRRVLRGAPASPMLSWNAQRLLAWSCWSGIRIYDLTRPDDRPTTRITRETGPLRAECPSMVRWHADGRRLCVTNDIRFDELIDGDQGRQIAPANPKIRDHYTGHLSPDCTRHICVNHADYDVVMREYPSHRPLYTMDVARGDKFVWSPDSSMVVACARGGLPVYKIIRAADGHWLADLDTLYTASWAPDNRHIVAVADSRLLLFELHVGAGMKSAAKRR